MFSRSERMSNKKPVSKKGVFVPKDISVSHTTLTPIHRELKDTIVAIRMPRSLIDELRDIQKINHFMDLSEEIRFIIRRYCMPRLEQGEQKSEDAYLEIKRKERIIEDLNKIIAQLKPVDNLGGNDAGQI
jgi:hypothetical protein